MRVVEMALVYRADTDSAEVRTLDDAGVSWSTPVGLSDAPLLRAARFLREVAVNTDRLLEERDVLRDQEVPAVPGQEDGDL